MKEPVPDESGDDEGCRAVAGRGHQLSVRRRAGWTLERWVHVSGTIDAVTGGLVSPTAGVPPLCPALCGLGRMSPR